MYMCHTSCFLLNTGPLVKYLERINKWMVAHPNEVVTLLLTNQDNADVSIFGKAMVNSGLAKLAYTPPKKLALNEWPTLQEMINSNKRLVMFLGRYMFCTLDDHFLIHARLPRGYSQGPIYPRRVRILL
jgi:hypothetical protein